MFFPHRGLAPRFVRVKWVRAHTQRSVTARVVVAMSSRSFPPGFMLQRPAISRGWGGGGGCLRFVRSFGWLFCLVFSFPVCYFVSHLLFFFTFLRRVFPVRFHHGCAHQVTTAVPLEDQIMHDGQSHNHEHKRGILAVAFLGFTGLIMKNVRRGRGF